MIGRTPWVLAALLGASAAAAHDPVEVETAAATKTAAGPTSLARRTELAVSVGILPARWGGDQAIVGLRLNRHLSDAFSVELAGGWTPISGFPPLITNLLFDRAVIPFDLYRVRGTAAGTLHFTPVEGSLTAGRRTLDFGMYALAGFGAVFTVDDARVLQCDPGDPCWDSVYQTHPTTNLGAGVRVTTSRLVARAELRRLSWVELFNGSALETKHRTVAELSLGAHFGARRDRKIEVEDGE